MKVILSPYIYRKCSKCLNEDFAFMKEGNQLGIYCSKCGQWLKWANKNESNLYELNKSVQPKARTGHWVFRQRNNDIEVTCSECGYIRLIHYACGYTLQTSEAQNYIDAMIRSDMKFCENCGTKMESGAEE